MNEILWSTVVIAAAFMPAYLLYYRTRVVPRRRKQIKVLLTEYAADAYCEVFEPGPHPEDVSPNDLIKRRFDESHSPTGYLWTGILAWLPSIIGIVVTALWARDRLEGKDGLAGEISTTLIMAFLGGYVWSLYELIERGRRSDLLPHTLIDVAYRILASVPIGYAFSLLVMEEVAAFAAFGASAFPVRDLRLFVRSRMRRQLEESASDRTVQREALLGQRVQGLSARNLARLREIEISTVVDLALADPIQLLVKTGLPLRDLIDWMDQSFLAMYVGDKLDRLAPMGIRGALEASHLFVECCGEPDAQDGDDFLVADDAESDASIVEFAEVLEVSPIFAVRLLWEIYRDPHVEFLSALWGEWSAQDEEAKDDAELIAGDT